MNIENVEIYGLGDFEPIPGFGDKGMVRVPAATRNLLNERARFIGMDSVGIEIRFVTDAPNIDVYISMQKPEFKEKGSYRIYKGNFLYQTIEVEPGITGFHRIVPPVTFDEANDDLLNQSGYGSNVWRIVCDRAVTVFHGINTHGHEIRKPKNEELPALHWLAYGSSITNSNLDGYPHFAAAKLRVQVQNKGFSGACHIEKVLVDYMLDQCRSDFITCELGVNMRNLYSPETFEERASYLIKRLVESGKPSLIISCFPNRNSDLYTKEFDKITSNEVAFNQILVRLVEEANCPTLELMHGDEVLTDVHGLSGDLIHPTTYGHSIMGMNLASRLEMFLNKCGLHQ